LVGSIICDTGLIFGLSCLLARLPMDRFILSRHGWLQFGAGALLVAASLVFVDTSTWTSVLPRSFGIFFVALLGGYILISIYWAKTHTAAARLLEAEVEETEHHAGAGASVAANALMLFIGLSMVIAASQILISAVKILCERWGVPPSIISATLIAFGTSLPELVTALTSIRRGHLDLVIGNIIGADILNVLFVTGAAACAAPLQVDSLFFRLHFPMMMAVLILFRLTVHFSKGTFARWPGVLFIGLHLSYVLLCLLFGVAKAH
jgi:cation:H+ antiporter